MPIGIPIEEGRDAYRYAYRKGGDAYRDAYWKGGMLIGMPMGMLIKMPVGCL